MLLPALKKKVVLTFKQLLIYSQSKGDCQTFEVSKKKFGHYIKLVCSFIPECVVGGLVFVKSSQWLHQ